MNAGFLSYCWVEEDTYNFPLLKTQSANAININVRAVEIPQLVMGHGTEVWKTEFHTWTKL